MPRTVTFTPRRFLRKFWQLGNFDVSPDGRLLAYSANKGVQWTVYVRDLSSGRERVLLRSKESVLNPEFSPDGEWIAVQSDFEGDENFDVYIIPATGGEARNLTHDPADDAFPRWSPDGSKIAFISNRDRDRDNLFVLDTERGNATQLTHFDDTVGEVAWRPDGTSIAILVGDGNLDWVGLVDLSGRVEHLVDFPDSESAIGGDVGRPHPWSPDGRELAFVSNVHDHLDIGVLEVEHKKVRWLVTSKRDKTMPLWSPDGKRVAFLENDNGNVQLRSVSASGGRPRTHSDAVGVAARPVWHPNGRALYFWSSTSVRPDELVVQSASRRERLVKGARVPLPLHEMCRARLVWYPTFDGRNIPAWLYMPPKVRSRRAAVVIPHGGPESQTLNEWDILTQFLVAEGYTILLPNYRGGTGYGRSWRRISDKDLGGDDMKDIIAAGRWLIKRRLCPLARLGILGVSYGGYAVAHCLEQAPDLWAVGVSIVGYFNWFTATTTERGYLQRYDRWKMGAPDTDADLFRQLSPIYYLDRIRAPVLFIGGAHDPRCPVTEARQMVGEMKRRGKVIEYLEFPDEGHWPRKMSNQIRLYERAIEWLNRFLPERPARPSSRSRRL